MSKLIELVTESRRLALLTILEDSAGYTAADGLLRMQAEQIGHSAGLDTILADLAWLRDTGLITLRDVGGIHIASLTTRGQDVAHGRTHVPGVARQMPGRC